jgi:GYF domain 2
MQIYVARNGQQLGQYSIEEVNRKLADGTLSATDLGWHEGAAGWAPLSSIAGVTKGAPGPPSIPAPLAPPSPAPTAPVAQSMPGSAPISSAPRSYKGMVLASWILLGLTFVISLIPVLGCGSWFLVWPVALATFIMAIVTLNRGGKTQGVLLLIASILIVPLALVAPVVTTAALGGVVSKEEHKQEAQIMENLRALARAKAGWVAQTKVKEGARTTVAGLAAYLDGREIKPVVGETYDPKPVGEEPTATLPATKSLAGHEKGAVLTAGDSTLPTGDETPPPTPEAL